MLIGHINSEFNQHNANRSYPLSERATKQPDFGAKDFTIPNNFLVAARIVVNAMPEQVDITKFYIGNITVYNGGVRILIHHESQQLAVGAVTAPDNNQLDAAFPIRERKNGNGFYGLTGHVTIGTFEQLRPHLGDYKFQPDATRFDPDVISYSAAAVTSITVIENGIAQPTIYGDIKIEAGENVKITTTHGPHTTLTIDRAPIILEPEICIKTINSVSPTPDGNINIVSNTHCLKLESGEASITIDETCCDPCCGCEELETLKNSIETLTQANTNIRTYQQQLLSQLNNLATILNITGV